MTYQETVDFLYSLRQFGLKLGLENTRTLANLAGNPQHRLRFIHVAGTNGKGSTCAMLEAICRQAGLRVGLFTSPHLISFTERIQVNRFPITEQEVITGVEALQPWLATFQPDHHPTFFEVVTLLALLHFERNRCDLVIWETGMGGRLDATNIVTPLASVITNIQLDHQAWLGSTHIQIAHEKGGIIKPGIPCLTSTDHPDALEVLSSIATRQNAPFEYVGPHDASRILHTLQGNGQPITISLPGPHQRRNAALAVRTLQHLSPPLPIQTHHILSGLATTRWDGRFETILQHPTHRVILDGAHNPEGALCLRETVETELPGQPITLILGMLADKDLTPVCHALAPIASRILIVPVNSDRTAHPSDLLPLCQAAPGAPTSITPCASLDHALKESIADPVVLITGSLYLVGDARLRLQSQPDLAPDRHNLNDWTQPHAPKH